MVPPETLTGREAQILNQIKDGQTNTKIGARLGITERTVKHHVGHILKKLGARDRAHAVYIGMKRGLIE